MSAVRVGFVGTGTVAALHAAALAEVDGITLTAAYDTDTARLARCCRDWGVRAAGSVDELVGADDVDVVLVLTPTPAHLAPAVAALRAGRHILVEKPVAQDAAAIRELAILAADAGLVALPGHNYLYLPEARRVVRHTREGRLGTPRAMFVTYALAHPEALAARYGPVLEELMVHHAYLAVAALGRPDRVSAGAAVPGWPVLSTSDQAWMTLEYDRDGTPTTSAHLFASFAVDDLGADPWTFVVKVLGTAGTSGYSWRSTTHRPDADGFSVGIPVYHETYVHQARALRDVVLGREPALTTLADAAVVADVLAAAGRAAQTHQSVTLP